MNKYKVVMTYQYTHEIEVEAESKYEAIQSAVELVDESNRIYDDHWYDSEATEIE